MALVVSSSRGVSVRDTLAGARADADAMAALLVELGGVASSDLFRLVDPDSTLLLRTFERIRGATALDSAQRVPSELVFYHAGHANLQGLELGRTPLPWTRLRAALSGTGAGTRVALVDACASGSLLRARGGRFVLPAPAPLRGEAWMVSSRAEEVSLETDADGGGIFTRVLLGGLRGGADRDRDGSVTFDEAFHHVAAGTRERARALGVSSQTPQWGSSLEGDRALVLTRPGNEGSAVVLPGRAAGILLRDSAGVGEAWIPPDTASSTIHLAPGLHAAWLQEGSVRKVHRFHLRPGETRQILSDEFVVLDLAAPAVDTDTTWNEVPVNFGLLSPLTLNGDHPQRAVNHFSLDLVLGEAGKVRGFQAAGVLTRVRHEVVGAQISSIANLSGGDVTGFQLGTVNLLGGGVTGAQWGWALNLDDGRSRGVQVAGLMNVNRDSLAGGQFATASSYAGSLHGAQISLVNVAGSLSGTQIGLVNIARESRGLQAGLVNVSLNSGGVAVGAINVLPRSRTLAVGALNVGQDLSVHPVVGISDGADPDLQIRYQTAWWRTLLLAESPRVTGWRRAHAARWGLGAGAAAGTTISCGADLLVVSRAIVPRSPSWGLQADARWNILDRLAPGLQVRWESDRPEELEGLLILAL